MAEERALVLRSITEVVEEQGVVDQSGLEFFWEAVEVLRKFGERDEVLVAPDLETMKGNKLCRILSTPLVPNEHEESGEGYFRLSISPASWFGSTLKPSLSINSIVWQGDNELPEFTGESWSVSRQGEIIKPGGTLCQDHEIERAREVLELINTSLINGGGVDFDDLMMSRIPNYVPRRRHL